MNELQQAHQHQVSPNRHGQTGDDYYGDDDDIIMGQI